MMPYTIRAFACADCGRWTVRRRKSNDPWICAPCGIDRRTLNLPNGGRPDPPPPDPPQSCTV